MMSFENIRIGVDVEVLRQGYLVSGKVRWKGQIPDKNGNWVGVELNDRGRPNLGIRSGLLLGTVIVNNFTTGLAEAVNSWSGSGQTSRSRV